MTQDEWLTRLAGALGVEPPNAAEIETLLALAGEAAHASVRTAAPLSCWLVGKAGVAPAAALDLARSLGHTAGPA